MTSPNALALELGMADLDEMMCQILGPSPAEPGDDGEEGAP